MFKVLKVLNVWKVLKVLQVLQPLSPQTNFDARTDARQSKPNAWSNLPKEQIAVERARWI